MKATEFAYWMQSLFEVADLKTLDEKQVQIIKNHLKLVFLYDIDPSYTTDKNLQQVFQNIHDGKEPFEGLIIGTIPAATWPDLSSTRPERKPNNGRNDVIMKC